MEKEITIAYDNEIQLTTSGLKNKEVFLKISPAFRLKQLKELKGSPLSVFVCYARHSDSEGYTWVDDSTVKKETGFYRTREARQKLIQGGYLYQERLYDEKGKFRDWIYRIFQPCENGRCFKVRGIQQYIRLHEQNDYPGKTPIQAKCEGIIEEEPIFIKEKPVSIVTNKKYTEKDKEMTDLLFTLMKENYSFIKNEPCEKDYCEMNRLSRIDGWDYKQIEYIIRWSQQDEFWRQNIRSVSKLRKQFSQLVIRVKENIKKNKITII